MQGSYFSYGLLAALAIALVVAAFTDLRRRQIDNWLNAAIALAAPLFWWAAGYGLSDVIWQLGVAALAFLALAGLFALGWMGGGDVKLLSVLALWVKPLMFVRLLMLMSLIGGVLTLAFGCWHIARRRHDRIAIPYGIAIASAGLWVLADTYLPGLRNGTVIG